jgi:hypothetical protein
MTDCYTLLLSIDLPLADALQASGMRIVLARHRPDTKTNVAWLAWDVAPRSVVSWGDEYGVFAAEPALQEGGQVRILREHPAEPSAVHTFSADGFATEPSDEILADHYSVRNDSGQQLAFGLVQSGWINGTAVAGPLNAVVDGGAAAPDFEPPTSVSMWLQRGVSTGTVVRIPDHATTFSLTEKARVVFSRYDEASGAFALVDTVVSSAWRRLLNFVPSVQTSDERCAAATARMVLSALGVSALPDEKTLTDIILTVSSSRFRVGHPDGLSKAINQFQQGPVQLVSTKKYESAPYPTAEATKRVMANSLLANEASGLVVLDGRHWVVLCGGDGAGPQTVDHVVVCDPLNGHITDFSGPVNPGGPSRNSLQHVMTFGEFVRSYGFKLSIPVSLPTGSNSPNGDNFVMVTDAAAKLDAVTAALITKRVAEFAAEFNAFAAEEEAMAERPDETTIQNAINAVLDTPDGAVLVGARQAKPRRVNCSNSRWYWLIPFVIDETSTHVLRLGASGRYLGIAYDVWYSDLYADEAAADFARRALADYDPERVRSIRAPSQGLVWHPTNESRNPYNPYYVFGNGKTRTYVSLGGHVATSLNDIVSEEPVEIQ